MQEQAKNKQRELLTKTKGIPTSDGQGVTLTRLIGGPDIPMLDPFLLLDFFGSDEPQDYIGGFPSHPHRGFETVTYMLAGQMRHKDSEGHEDVIGPGDLQWMTAGRGLVHSEMPEQKNGELSGFQLWVNLPAVNKMDPPAYRALQDKSIPVDEQQPGVRIKVMAGQTQHGTRGPLTIETVKPVFFDVTLQPESTFSQSLVPSHEAFVYVISGEVQMGHERRSLDQQSLGILGLGDSLTVSTKNTGARFLLVAGRPLGEPVARYGPFVMNTREELVQTIEDYQNGRF